MRRTTLRDFRRLRKDLENVQERSDALEKSNALIHRFVEWFEKRGAAYQHNYTVIEQQLIDWSSAAIQRSASLLPHPGQCGDWAQTDDDSTLTSDAIRA